MIQPLNRVVKILVWLLAPILSSGTAAACSCAAPASAITVYKLNARLTKAMVCGYIIDDHRDEAKNLTALGTPAIAAHLQLAGGGGSRAAKRSQGLFQP